MQSQEQEQEEILQRIQASFSSILRKGTLDLDYVLEVAQQELSSAKRASKHLNIPPELINSLQEVVDTLSLPVQSAEEASAEVSDIENASVGKHGRPRLEIQADELKTLLSSTLPLQQLAKLYGVSRRTLNRRMKESGLSVRGCYSKISDDDLDRIVRSIKSRMPRAGYRLVKGELLARGCRVQWHRVKATMRRINGLGISTRMIQLIQFLARTSCSVPGPSSLGTNDQPIRRSKRHQRDDVECQSETTHMVTEQDSLQDSFEVEVTLDKDECNSVKNRPSDLDSDMKNGVETSELTAPGADDSCDEDVYVPIITQRSTLSELLLECEEEELEPWQKINSHVSVKEENVAGEMIDEKTDCKPDPSLLQSSALSTSPAPLKTQPSQHVRVKEENVAGEMIDEKTDCKPDPSLLQSSALSTSPAPLKTQPSQHVRVKEENVAGEMIDEKTDCKPDPSLLQISALSTSPAPLKTQPSQQQALIMASPQLIKTVFIGPVGTQCSAGNSFTIVPVAQQNCFQKMATPTITTKACDIVHTSKVHQISKNLVSLSSVKSPAVYVTPSNQLQSHQSNLQTLPVPFSLPGFTVIKLQSTGTLNKQ